MGLAWQLGTKRINLDRPRIMAIANATPDSFFAGSRLQDNGAARREALSTLLAEGADIIDVGGQSTRPGSERVGAEEELRRVVPVIEELRRINDTIPVTVDTYFATVARAALDSGADGVNDISAGRIDDALLPLVAERGCGYVLMHMQGTPESMQREPTYVDCVAEVGVFLAIRLGELEVAGIDRRRVVADPGVGFGKRLGDNIALMTSVQRLYDHVGIPLLYGISRKSFIAMLSGEQNPQKRLAGSLGATWELLNQGVMLHRVHDVAATRQLLDVWQGMRNTG